MEAVWIALGGNVALLAVVAFLGKALISQWLNKDLDRFKQELTHQGAQQLETLRSNLQIAASEHAIILTKLQEKRAEIIGELYGQISAGVRELTSYVRPLQLVGEADQPTKAAAARQALMAAHNSFDDNRVWLTADCANQAETFLEALRSTFNRYDVMRQAAARDRGDRAQRDANDAVMAAWDQITGAQFTATRRSLEGEMRKLLEPSRAAQ